MDAQFGGVDQRKIFTFAEKVRTRAVGQLSVTLASGLGLRHSLTIGRSVSGFSGCCRGSSQLLLSCSAGLCCAEWCCHMSQVPQNL